MKQQSKPKQTNPLVISVIGLMLILFGIADILFDKKVLGIILLAAGFILGISGIQRYKLLKEQLAMKKQK
ncbi:hypothetical protein [Cohnella silvisoli]|uniref:DUF3188 domain-containing protein n=1 Tax=Cohnella silvisoli TaxID=2873699 RepID=A0ABV1L3I7_9BACL|nr:hypothetical protein [Cohnella silvisoli]MCD9026130.1 hypothetical protein [Cohnella silvisoli]